MTEIRPARAAGALRLAGQLAQLGYPGEPDAVTSRLAGIAAYVPLPLRGGEQRLNAEPVIVTCQRAVARRVVPPWRRAPQRPGARG